jgi:hypothetical protein
MNDSSPHSTARNAQQGQRDGVEDREPQPEDRGDDQEAPGPRGEPPECLGDVRAIPADRGDPRPGARRLDAEEQHQGQQEHQVRGQPGEPGQEPADERNDPPEVQLVRDPPHLLRSHGELTQRPGARADERVRRRGVLGEERHQPGRRDQEYARQYEDDRVHDQQQDGRRQPPGYADAPQPRWSTGRTTMTMTSARNAGPISQAVACTPAATTVAAAAPARTTIARGSALGRGGMTTGGGPSSRGGAGSAVAG